MKTDDLSNFTTDENGIDQMWRHGEEIWCNKQGRYLHIVADLSHLVGFYRMNLCSVGIMGT